MAKRIDKDSFEKSKALISVDIYHNPSSAIALLIERIIIKKSHLDETFLIFKLKVRRWK